MKAVTVEREGLRIRDLIKLAATGPVILTENATEQVKFVSANDKAKKYTIRVRQAR